MAIPEHQQPRGMLGQPPGLHSRLRPLGDEPRVEALGLARKRPGVGDQAVLGASPDDRVEDARSLIEDGRAVDEPAIGIAVKGADHGAGLRIDLVPALLSPDVERSEEHTSELQSLMRISYAVFCLKKKINK